MPNVLVGGRRPERGWRMSEKGGIMYCDFLDKKAVSVYHEGRMMSFLVEPSAKRASGKESRHLPSEDALAKEVDGYLGGSAVALWDIRKLRAWKLRPHQVVIDLRDFYEFRVKPLSLRLNDVAVGEGFVPRGDLLELDKVLKEGKGENILKYTSRNADWCSRLDPKYNFTASLFSLMRLVGAPNLDYVLHGSILPIELLLARIAKERGETLPKIHDTGGIQRYEGGFVLEPPVGLFHDVAILDFSKYFPSIIMDFNISPELTKIVDSKPVLDFSRRGLIPAALEYLTKTRNEIEEKLGRAKPDDPEWLRLTSDREAVKVTQNAMYGALASDQFTMQSRGLAALIAALGREGIKETIAECERRGLRVLYADTDSVSVGIGREGAERLGKDLTGHLQDYFRTKYQLPTARSEIKLKFSRYARSIIFLGKKNYALWDGKTVEIVGLFRQARSHFSQRFQEELYAMVLKGNSLRDVECFVKECLLKFRRSSLEDVALCTKINQPLDQYKVASWHIKGARNAFSVLGIKFDVGDTIKLVWLRGKDIIGFEYEGQVAGLKDQVDWERMEDSIRSLAEPILEILGKGREAKQKTLFD